MGYGYPFSYIHTGEGALYLSMIWDLYDNSIAAYRAVAQQMVNLVLDTIRLAIKIEKTKAAAEVQLHSGQPVAIPNSFRGWAAEDILNSHPPKISPDEGILRAKPPIHMCSGGWREPARFPRRDSPLTPPPSDLSNVPRGLFYNISDGAYTIGNGGGAHVQYTYYVTSQLLPSRKK